MNKAVIIIFVLVVLISLVGCKTVQNDEIPSQNPIESDSQQLSLKWNEFSEGNVLASEKYIYFSNRLDDNRLCRMDRTGENIQRISDYPNASDRLLIQEQNNILYYLQSRKETDDYVFNLYSYNPQTGQNKLLIENNIFDYVVWGSKILFTDVFLVDQNGDYPIKKSNIYEMELDGGNLQLIDSYDFLCNIQISNGEIYVDFDEALVSLSRDSSENKSKYIGLHRNLTIYSDCVYYVGADGYLYTSDIDADIYNNSIVINRLVQNFIIYDNQIFIVSNDNKIYKSELNGKNMEYLVCGSSPVIRDDVLYYFNSNNVFCSFILK